MAVDITALKQWLLEKAGPHLADQERQAIESALAKEQVAQVFNEGFAGRSEINRRLDEIRAQEQQIKAAADAELQRHIGTLQQWQQGERSKYEQAYRQYEDHLAALRKQMEDEGVQPSAATPAKPTIPAPNGNGSAKYITEEQFNNVMMQAAFLPTYTVQILEQHRQLFGAVPDMEKITQTSLRTGRNIVETWRDIYKVGDKEAEVREAAVQKRIDDEVNARITKLQADAAMGQQNFQARPGERPSPIRMMMDKAREAAANSPLAIPAPVMQESEAVKEAVQAYQEGRYRTQT